MVQHGLEISADDVVTECRRDVSDAQRSVRIGVVLMVANLSSQRLGKSTGPMAMLAGDRGRVVGEEIHVIGQRRRKIRIVRCKFHRPAMAPDSLIDFSGSPQRRRQVGKRLGKIRLDLHGPTQPLGRFTRSAELGTHHAHVVQHAGVIRLELEGLEIFRHRLRGSAKISEPIGQPNSRCWPIRLGGDGPTEFGNRGVPLLLLFPNAGQIHVKTGFGPDGDRRQDKFGSFREAALLNSHHAQQMQRIGLMWFLLQDGRESRLRTGQITGLKPLDCLPQLWLDRHFTPILPDWAGLTRPTFIVGGTGLGRYSIMMRDDRPASPSDTMVSHRKQCFFSGRVQGVGFRYTVTNIALQHNISGYVRNLPDGRVELVMEGADDEMDELIRAVRNRMNDYIRKVDQNTLPATGEYTRFQIQH